MEIKQIEYSRALGIGNDQISDAQVAENILHKLPKGTYSFIAVQTIQYKFFSMEKAIATRQIALQPKNWEFLVNVIRVLGSEIPTINTNRSVRAILGSEEDQDIKHLKTSFRANYTFFIYISKDLTNFYFVPTPSIITDWAEWVHIKGARIVHRVSKMCVIS